MGNDIIEILKTSTPIVALLAMFFTPWFTAKFNKDQKKRDELFSYKVKAYMYIAKNLYKIRNEYLNRSDKMRKQGMFIDYNALPIDLHKLSSEEYTSNILFLDLRMQNKMHEFTEFMTKQIYKLETITSNNEDYYITYEYLMIIVECDNLIQDLQNEVGMNTVAYTPRKERQGLFYKNKSNTTT